MKLICQDGQMIANIEAIANVEIAPYGVNIAFVNGQTWGIHAKGKDTPKQLLWKIQEFMCSEYDLPRKLELP
ncbi:MAG: hypothetical protein IKZ87_06255 [Actinomycetaceae bacterium]|nr:hypothetical protein [Actinomycetaceae bacterium]